MNDLDIKITKPLVKDINTLWKWGEENWELWSDNKNKWYSKQNLKKWFNNFQKDILLIARYKDKPVGMFFLYNLNDWSMSTGMFVVPSLRKKGIGKMLLNEAEKRLKKKGIKSISLLVDVKNIEGLNFWKKVGFHEGFKFIWMSKKL